MNREQITRLLVAAMQRHITWEGDRYKAFTPSSWAAFTIDKDVTYKPPFGVEDEDRHYLRYPAFDEGKPVTVHYDENDPATIKHGVYFLATIPGTDKLQPYTFYSPEPVEGEQTGDMVSYTYNAMTLVTAFGIVEDEGHREARIETRLVSFFELLALMAIQDARAAGRADDETALVKLIPRDYGSHLTEDQEAEILSHVGEAKPDIVRAGSKIWTDIMGANSFHGNTYDGNGISAPLGTAVTFAGTHNEVVIHTDSPADSLSVDAGTMKLLYQLNGMITKIDPALERGKEVEIETSFDELLKPRKKTPTRKNNEAIRRQIETLHTTRLRFETAEVEDGSIDIISSRLYYRRGGRIQITISPKFKMFLLGHNVGLVPVDPVLLTTDDMHHPNAWAIGSRLNSHTFMNYTSATRYRLSVEKLLANVKSIPTVEDLDEQGVRGNSNRTKRIVVPLERDLNHLVEIGFLKYWDYCHSNGEPLTDTEQAARIGSDGEVTALPYSIAKACLITWEPVNDYVGQMQSVTDARARKKLRDIEDREAKAVEAEKKARRIERKTEAEVAKLRARALVEGETP